MNLPGLCQSCAARNFDCMNELDRIERTSTREGVYECSRYKFKEATMSNYCGDCEHFPGEGKHCHEIYTHTDMRPGAELPPTFAASAACRKFEAKKRGICVHPQPCPSTQIIKPKSCDNKDCKYNFKVEA